MRIIGLTGGIACGKSTVSQALIARGYPVVDGDVLSHELTGENGAALPAIRRAFGAAVFREDGSLNRKKLGEIVFGDDRARGALDGLMAPLLREAILRAIREAEMSGAALCFLDLPLLFEKGYDSLCDSVWCVTAPEPVQIERLMERDGCTEREARRRIQAQMPTGEKAARSGFVIDNSGTVANTLAQLPGRIRAELEADRPWPTRSRRMDRYTEPEEPVEGSDSQSSPASRRSPDQPISDQLTADLPTIHQPIPEQPISPQSPAQPSPSGQHPAPAETVIERSPERSRRPARRKVAWKMPVWLRAILIPVTALLLIAFTAQCLMMGYLARQAQLHEAEQQSIDANYPVQYRELIEQQAAEYNLNPAYVTAIIRNESSFRPQAESSVGARGLMQLMPDTAEWIAGKLKTEGYAFERMYDPESNITFGCWYLNYLSRLFSGDAVCVTCAYHAGQGTVSAWLSDSRYSADGKHLLLDQLPEGPTRQYAERVTRDYGIYQKKVYAPEDDVPAEQAASAL